MSAATHTTTYRPKLRKRILKHPLARGTLTLLVSLILRAIFATCRVSRHIHDDANPYASGQHQAILCFWHGRMVLTPFFKPKHRAATALISSHGDGAIITDILRWLGVASVRGSSSRGGEKALRSLRSIIATGSNICITPDGPRGPNEHCAMGAIWLAANSQLPIIPISISSTRRRHAKSWDKFLIPLPFARIHLVVGNPISVSATDDLALESSRTKLESVLRELTLHADTLALERAA